MLVRLAIVIAVGGWLIWQIGALCLATLAERSGNPGLLVAMGTPAHPDAAALLAQGLLATKHPAEAARLARSAVLVDPISDRALRVLGLATTQLGQGAQGDAIMNQAAALGWRDTPTQLWTLRYAALHGDLASAMQRADALARRDRMSNVTYPVFRASVADPELRRVLIDSLVAKPMWRGAFFADIRQNLPANAGAGMEALLHELDAREGSKVPVEWLSYVDRLVSLGEFRHARLFWAGAFGIAASRLVAFPYDPDFASVAARPTDAPVSPFEWRLNPDLADAVSFGGSRGATTLDVPGHLAGGTPILSQLLVLPPGAHQLSARVRGSAAAAAAGWTVTCLPSQVELPRRLARGSDDELTTVGLDVPASGCGAQRLSLVSRDRLDSQAVSIAGVRMR